MPILQRHPSPSSRRRRIARIATVLTLLGFPLYVILIDGPASEIMWHEEVSLQRLSPPVHGQAATVFWTGFDSHGPTHAQPIAGELALAGDALAVSYPRRTFDEASFIIPSIHRQLLELGYTKVTLVGTSLGGQMAIRFINYDLDHGKHLKFNVILIDTPLGAEDLTNNAATVMSWAHFGATGNWLLSGVHSHWVFKPPLASQVSPLADRQIMERNHRYSAHWPVSGLAAQARSLLDFSDLRTYPGIPAAIVRSEHDTVVNHHSDAALQRAFPGASFITVKGANHVDITEHPQEWRTALRPILAGY